MARTALGLVGLLLVVWPAAGPATARAQPASPAEPAPAAPEVPADEAAPRRPLGLEEAIRLAASRHEDPRIALARLDRARAIRRQAVAGLFPRVSVSATYNRRANEVVRDFAGESVAIQRFNALNAQALLESTIFDPRAIPLLRGAELDVEATAIEADEIRRRLSFDVAESYFGVLGSEQLVAAAQRRLALADETVADARRRLEAGLAATGEVIRAELEQASARVTVAETVRGVAQARLALGMLIVEPANRPLEEPPETELPDEPQLEEKAVEGRPDLAAAEVRVESARQLAREPWFRLLPALALRALSTATNEPGFGPPTNWNIALTLSWAIFDGGVRYAEAAARNADVDAALLSTDQLRRRIAYEVQSARTDLEASATTLRAADARATVARRNVDDVQLRQRAGLANALEQADAAVSAFEADTEIVRQRFALRRAQLALLAALGRWPSSDPGAPK